MRTVTAALILLGLVVAACSDPDLVTSTTQMQTPATSPSVTGTTTVSPAAAPTSVPEQPDARTRVHLVDPATLEPTAAAVELPGFLSADHAVLPDGRLVLFSWEGETWSKGRLTLLDPRRGGMETIAAPLSTELRVLGYSPALEQVVLLDWSEKRRLTLFDPVSLSLTAPLDDLFATESVEWPSEAALFDGGRKVALYSWSGIGNPPRVRIVDLVNGLLGEAIEVEGAVHGPVELPPDMVRDPDWPYGEANPGIAFDEIDGRLFVAHADGKGLTVVDLVAESVEVVALGRQPSFWTKALSWLIPPAEAKGTEPAAHITAWLSADRSRLLVTGSASDAWRESKTRKLHTSTTPLGLTVIDTETLEVVATLDLPVSQGVSTMDAIALAGSSSNLVWCDQECNPANNDPEVEGEFHHSGLYILDPATLEVRLHHRPGGNFYTIDVFDHWLVAESFGPDGDYYESIDLATGTPAGRVDFSESFFVVTDLGILKVQFVD